MATKFLDGRDATRNAILQLGDFMMQEHPTGRLSFVFFVDEETGENMVEARIDSARGELITHSDQSETMIDATEELAAKTEGLADG